MVKVEVDLKLPYAKLSSSAVNTGQFFVANQMLADMNPFIPMREGILRLTGHVTYGNNAIEWVTPYAKRMFYEQHYNYTTPGTGPRWDLKASGLFMNDWIQVFMMGAGW